MAERSNTKIFGFALCAIFVGMLALNAVFY